MKQATQNEGSKTKEVVQKSEYEIAEEETVTFLMKYNRKYFLYKKQLALMPDLVSNFEHIINEKGLTAD